MKLLLDTQILLWATIWPDILSEQARDLLSTGSELFFSPASIWEVSIKNSLNKRKPRGCFSIYGAGELP